MLKAVIAGYNHADALLTLAIVALIYFAWRSPTVDLAGFGEGVATIFTGRGAHSYMQSKGDNGQ